MALSVFPYVGGKTLMANWIIKQLPEHDAYVEPFGGSAAVLLNKPRSNVEVYNDVDGDVVQFFDVARNRTDKLVEWVNRTPFSEELHNEWGRAFYRGERPDDPVERAGRFLFLRYSAFAGEYASHSGFKRDTLRSRDGESKSWMDAPQKIQAAVDRLQGVSIQNNDFKDIIERYDGPDTVFYCDPPYLGTEQRYPASDGFSHSALAAVLADIDGYALVSYTDQPEGLYDDWQAQTRESHHNAGTQDENSTKKVRERLLTNFDPENVPRFETADQSQTRLTRVSDA